MFTFKEYLMLDEGQLEEMMEQVMLPRHAPKVPGRRDTDKDRQRNHPWLSDENFRDEVASAPSQKRSAQNRKRFNKRMGNEEEEETKRMADQDRAKRFDDQVAELSDKDYKDVLHSEPGNKRMKQRFARNKRRTWGNEEEEMKMGAKRKQQYDNRNSRRTQGMDDMNAPQNKTTEQRRRSRKINGISDNDRYNY